MISKRIITFISIILVNCLISTVKAETPQVIEWNNQLNKLDIIYNGLNQQIGGISPAQLKSINEQQKAILNQAGMTRFNSFSSFTDNSVSLYQENSPTTLLRRGYPEEQLSQWGIGAWFTDKYVSINQSRNGNAVLEAWGNPQTSIYVIKVPNNEIMIDGYAAPQRSSDGKEYRPGGDIQYWIQNDNKETNNWLLYAIYSPDYLKSYSTNVTAAQRLGRVVVDDLQLNLENIRHDNLAILKDQQENNSDKKLDTFKISARAYNLNISGSKSNDKTFYYTQGSNIGIDKGINHKQGLFYFGGFSGYAGINSTVKTAGQDDEGFIFTDYSNIKNTVRNVHGGAYLLYQQKYKGYYKPHFFADASIIGGMLQFTNKVPGYSGKGFTQHYYGGNFLSSLETGLTFILKKGFVIEPEATLNYNKIMHENFNDKIMAPVTLLQGTSLRTGAGIKLKKSILNFNKFKAITFLNAKYERDFLAVNKIGIEDESASDNQKGNFFCLGGGVDLKIINRLSLHAEMLKLLGKEHGYRGSFSFNFFI